MTADLALLIGIIVLLIVASAFFSSAETALTAVSYTHLTLPTT